MDEDLETASPGTQLRHTLSGLPLLGDDLYLRLQATNLGLVDDFLSELESSLRAEYFQEDRTPLPSAAFLSALSQLWIFGVYELLRTWRQRAREAIALADQLQGLTLGERTSRLEKERERIRETSPYGDDLHDGRWSIVTRIDTEPTFVDTIRAAYDKSEWLFRRLEALRVHLGKHEVPKQKRVPALWPGYGRIDPENGSIYYQFLTRPPQVDVLSRRDVGEMCRDLITDKSNAMLPRAVRDQLRSIAEFGYGAKMVSATLKDGRKFDDVIVVCDCEISAVGTFPDLPFDAREVISVESQIKREDLQNSVPPKV